VVAVAVIVILRGSSENKNRCRIAAAQVTRALSVKVSRILSRGTRRLPSTVNNFFIIRCSRL
jgi:hypothetical protein